MDPITFQFFDLNIELLPEFIEIGRIVAPDGYGGPEAASVRLDEFMEHNYPDGYRHDVLSLRKRAELLAILHTAYMSGLDSYPTEFH